MSGTTMRGLICLLLACGLAHGQAAKGSGASTLVTMTAAYVQNCIQIDELLRKTCARIGPNLSDRNRKFCELPAVPFEARTARSYAAFKETHRAEFKENEAAVARSLTIARSSFERQFAEVRAGRVSMPDLESLSRELGDRCTTVETEWLAPNRTKK